MKTTFEIQQSISSMDKKMVLERCRQVKNIWNVTVNLENQSISFEYLNRSILDIIRRELSKMGYFVINDTHQMDTSTEP